MLTDLRQRVFLHNIGKKSRWVETIAESMSRSPCSTSSLFSHCLTTPTFAPLPHAFEVSMLFLAAIDYIANVWNRQRGLSNVCRNDKFSSISRRILEYLLLQIRRQRRVKFVDDEVVSTYLEVFSYLCSPFNFIVLFFYFLWIVGKSLLQHDRDFVDFIFPSHEDEDIAIGQCFMNSNALFDSWFFIVLRSILLKIDRNWKHPRFHIYDWDKIIEQILIPKILNSHCSRHDHQSQWMDARIL